MRSGARAAAIVAIAALRFAPAFADDLLYYVEDGQMVITNTPSRSDAKPIPRLRGGAAQRASSLPATPYDPYIDRVAREHGVDPTLVKAVALVESGFNARAVSSKGAVGLMQLMPKTAADYGVTDPRDPYQNLNAGAKHLRGLLDRYDGDLTLALAAYNAGSGAVSRYGGVPAYAETRDYVKKVQAKMGRAPRKGGGRLVSAASSTIQMRVESDGSVTLFN